MRGAGLAAARSGRTPGTGSGTRPGVSSSAHDPDGEVVDLQLHVAARRALRSNRRHAGPPPRHLVGPLASRPGFGTPGQRHLRTARRVATRVRQRSAVHRTDHLRPPGRPAPTTREHPGRVPPGARAGRPGLESDARLSADGEVVLVHDAVARRGWRRRRVGADDGRRARASSTCPASPTSTTSSAPTTSSRSTCTTPRPARRWSRVGGRRRRPRPALAVLGADARSLERSARGHPTRALVHSTRRRSIDGPARAPRGAPRRGRASTRCNMHHTDWTAGLVALFHRFERAGVRVGRSRRCATCARCSAMGIDAVYSDHVDRMVATVAEWQRLTTSQRYRKPRRSSGQMRTKHAADDARLLDRAEVTRRPTTRRGCRPSRRTCRRGTLQPPLGAVGRAPVHVRRRDSRAVDRAVVEVGHGPLREVALRRAACRRCRSGRGSHCVTVSPGQPDDPLHEVVDAGPLPVAGSGRLRTRRCRRGARRGGRSSAC